MDRGAWHLQSTGLQRVGCDIASKPPPPLFLIVIKTILIPYRSLRVIAILCLRLGSVMALFLQENKIFCMSFTFWCDKKWDIFVFTKNSEKVVAFAFPCSVVEAL